MVRVNSDGMNGNEIYLLSTIQQDRKLGGGVRQVLAILILQVGSSFTMIPYVIRQIHVPFPALHSKSKASPNSHSQILPEPPHKPRSPQRSDPFAFVNRPTQAANSTIQPHSIPSTAFSLLVTLKLKIAPKSSPAARRVLNTATKRAMPRLEV